METLIEFEHTFFCPAYVSADAESKLTDITTNSCPDFDAMIDDAARTQRLFEGTPIGSSYSKTAGLPSLMPNFGFSFSSQDKAVEGFVRRGQLLLVLQYRVAHDRGAPPIENLIADASVLDALRVALGAGKLPNPKEQISLDKIQSAATAGLLASTDSGNSRNSDDSLSVTAISSSDNHTPLVVKFSVWLDAPTLAELGVRKEYVKWFFTNSLSSSTIAHTEASEYESLVAELFKSELAIRGTLNYGLRRAPRLGRNPRVLGEPTDYFNKLAEVHSVADKATCETGASRGTTLPANADWAFDFKSTDPRLTELFNQQQLDSISGGSASAAGCASTGVGSIQAGEGCVARCRDGYYGSWSKVYGYDNIAFFASCAFGSPNLQMIVQNGCSKIHCPCRHFSEFSPSSEDINNCVAGPDISICRDCPEGFKLTTTSSYNSNSEVKVTSSGSYCLPSLDLKKTYCPNLSDDTTCCSGNGTFIKVERHPY